MERPRHHAAMYRALTSIVFACVLVHGADTDAHSLYAWPLWDGNESIQQYAKRANLLPTRTLDLGNGVRLEMVLIPAGRFIIGVPRPNPVDTVTFERKVRIGQATLAVGVGVLAVLVGTVIIRASRNRHRLQYSLARFLAMMLATSAAVLGGMHWWHSEKTLAQAQFQYAAASARYRCSYEHERPAHEVTLTTPFYIGQYEVTQEQYEHVMSANPSRFRDATLSLPVESVSWHAAKEFCKKVSAQVRQTVRLPTDAEFEYACRAGTATTYTTDKNSAEKNLNHAAWYIANSKSTTHPVGQTLPNAWGVYDMLGNVWEWCEDWYSLYKAAAVVNPQGPNEGQGRVSRGGSWLSAPWACQYESRCSFGPHSQHDNVGFRVVLTVRRLP